MADLSVAVVNRAGTDGIGHYTFPLRVHSSGRYLTTYTGAPFLLLCTSPQGMISDLTPAQMDSYMSTRASQGYNCLQVHLLSGSSFGGNSSTFEAQDGTTPFTSGTDISTPREAFFVQVDALLALAESYGLCVMLDAAETIDAESLFTGQSEATCFAFGQYLGARYASVPNLIWNYGNDFIDSTTEAIDLKIRAVRNGVAAEDLTHLHTVWLMPWPTSDIEASRQDSDWENLVDLDLVYCYRGLYNTNWTEYALNPAKPLFLGESNYEDESLIGYLTTPAIVRRQNYWAMCSGACGVTVDHSTTWDFNTGWETNINDTAQTEVQYLKSLFEAYNWHLLVPDTTASVLTAGSGTPSSTESHETGTYRPCARASDGSLIVVYVPNGSSPAADLTIDMTKMTPSSVRCRWYDPTDGSFTAIGTYANTGTHDFTPSAGDSVLVLDEAP